MSDTSETCDKDAFVVHLSRGMNGSFRVTSLELILSDMRNRYSFNPGQQIEGVFSEDFAHAIYAAMASVDTNDRIVSLPDFEMRTDSLVVSGLRILITRMDHGVQAIMLRFRNYVGAIKSVFRFDPSMSLDCPTMREKIAVEVLRDIVTPLFDVVAFSRIAPSRDLSRNQAAIEQRLTQISSRQEELSFYVGLLHRYVSGCRTDALAKGGGIELQRLQSGGH